MVVHNNRKRLIHYKYVANSRTGRRYHQVGTGFFSSLFDSAKSLIGRALGSSAVQKGLNVVKSTATNLYNDNKDKLIAAAKESALDFAKEKGGKLMQDLQSAENAEDAKRIFGANLKELPGAAKARLSERMTTLADNAKGAARDELERQLGAALGSHDETGSGLLQGTAGNSGRAPPRRRRGKKYVSLI